MQIEAYTPHHLDAVVRLSLRAWTPVFDSLQSVMNADVYQAFYPNQWQVSQSFAKKRSPDFYKAVQKSDHSLSE